MRTLRIDSVGGASGDMILGALIDLGISPEELQRQLQSLPVEEFSLESTIATDCGISGTRVSVTVHDHHHPHRNLSDIKEIIGQSNLPVEVTTAAIRTFELLATAEAKVHGTSPDKIHFHEVGAMDAIIDIVGCCLGLHLLGIDRVDVGPLPVGRGTTDCQHGILPLPVPAVAELLIEHAVQQTDQPFEMITPTGAALLMSWKTSNEPANNGQPSGPKSVAATGYGLGHRSLDGRANIIRGTILECTQEDVIQQHECQPQDAQCLLIESNIDDTIPELIGSLSVLLLQAGALDVFTTAVQMKKQRPGTMLSILCRPCDRDHLIDLVFSESTTFGVREQYVNRTILDRRHFEVDTPYGTVGIKAGYWRGKQISLSPEHADCVRRATENHTAIRAVYESALMQCGKLRHTPPAE